MVICLWSLHKDDHKSTAWMDTLDTVDTMYSWIDVNYGTLECYLLAYFLIFMLYVI
jgi:hypothetical protein